MSGLDIKINANGELIELKDLNKIVEALTKKQRKEIDNLKQDIISIDNKRITAKKFEILGNDKMRKSLNNLTSNRLDNSSLFKQMVAIPVGISIEDYMKYLDVKVNQDITNNSSIDRSLISLQPIQLATSSKWQSMSFSSRISSVTDQANSINTNRFKDGEVKLLVQDNAISLVQKFNSQVSSVVGIGSGGFNPGTLFINNNPINLILGDSLNSICNKINNAKIGVKASIVDTNNTPQFKLLLQSDKIGAENSVLIDDPNQIFTQLNNSSGEYFISDPHYETLTLSAGDNLNNIAYHINKFEKTTNLHADVLETCRGQYTLMLKSLGTGIDNAFQIIDKDIISNEDIVLNGQNSGKVFGDLFNDTIAVIKGTQALIYNPQDARLIVDGTLISSSINSFDVYNDFNVTIKSPSTTPITLDSRYDINRIFHQINELVDQYNLFRQIYLDSFNIDSLQLIDSSIIKTTMDGINLLFQRVAFMDIGLSQGILELETLDKDSKTIKKEYPKMLILDQHKLVQILTENPEKIRHVFDLVFDSTSNNFVQPLISKPITINNKSLGPSVIDLGITINTSEIKVRSYSSNIFNDTTNVVDSIGVDTTKFKQGTFWINGSAIKIITGMSIGDVVSAINSVSNMSRISAVNNGNYISLTKYTGNFTASDDDLIYKNINFYDPNNILQDVFSSIMKTGVFNDNDLPSTGTFLINGISISAQTSVQDLVDEINDISDQTGVEAIMFTSGNSYYIEFITNVLQDIVIDNSGGGLGTISFPTTATQQSNKYFFDTSYAVNSSLMVDGRHYNNKMVLIINGNDIASGGKIVPLYINNQSNIKIDNLEVLFVGNENDSAQISISQGLAASIINQLDDIFGVYNGYKGSTSKILQFNNQIDNKKAGIAAILKRKEDALEKTKDMLLRKFSAAQSKVDTADVYINMIKSMMDSND